MKSTEQADRTWNFLILSESEIRDLARKEGLTLSASEIEDVVHWFQNAIAWVTFNWEEWLRQAILHVKEEA